MARLNFMLGRGEELTEDVTTTGKKMKINYPYSLEESLHRLLPQFSSVSEAIAKLPDEACPINMAVELITLNPSFIAKSYFPDSLLRCLDICSLGSRNTRVQPEKWNRKSPPEEVTSTQLFVAGKRCVLHDITSRISSFVDGSNEAEDLCKIETVGIHQPIVETSLTDELQEQNYYEIGLHLLPGRKRNQIKKAFAHYADVLDIEMFQDISFDTGNLWFLPVKGKRSHIEQLALFSFIRVIRIMPRLREIPTSSRTGTKLLKAKLPDNPPIMQDLRVAILDGGLPKHHHLEPWLIDSRKLDPSEDDVGLFNEHGLGVSSSFLFGPIHPGKVAERPIAPITHLRILDEGTEKEHPLELYRTLGMIEDVLISHQYQFLNLSVGPNLPVQDSEVHGWTAVIDDHLSDGQTLLTVAVGNNGEEDQCAQQARIQIPSDCVNGISVGAVDSMEETWSRAPYSAIGPGRSPGRVKPDVLAFGGGYNRYFHVLTGDKVPSLAPLLGTSFSAPFLLRTAVGIKAFLGDDISILAVKALLLHCADQGSHNRFEVGWGRVPSDLSKLLLCPECSARIVYQGVLRSGTLRRMWIPLPDEPFQGMITLKATICIASEVDPEDSGAYTRSGVEIMFRPHIEKKQPDQHQPKTQSFFSRKEYSYEEELRSDAGKWETVLKAQRRFQYTSLYKPCFDVHYIARKKGGRRSAAHEIPYALIITITTPSIADIGERIMAAYPSLQVLQPMVELPAIPVRT